MTQASLFDPEQRAAERGIARAGAAHYRDLQLAREIAKELYLGSGRPICADDVRAEMSRRFPDTVYGNWMGAVWKGQEWRPVGFTHSKTKNSHSNLLRTWVLK